MWICVVCGFVLYMECRKGEGIYIYEVEVYMNTDSVHKDSPLYDGGHLYDPRTRKPYQNAHQFCSRCQGHQITLWE